MPDIFSAYWRHVLVFLDNHFAWNQSRLVSNANSKTRVLRTTTTALVSTVPILTGGRYLRCFSFTYCISWWKATWAYKSRRNPDVPRHARVRLNFDSRSSTPHVVLLYNISSSSSSISCITRLLIIDESVNIISIILSSLSSSKIWLIFILFFHLVLPLYLTCSVKDWSFRITA